MNKCDPLYYVGVWGGTVGWGGLDVFNKGSHFLVSHFMGWSGGAGGGWGGWDEGGGRVGGCGQGVGVGLDVL